MRFLVDAQLPPDLAAWIGRQGHQADHIFDHLSPNAEDENVWKLAVQLSAVLMTKGEDFISIRLREGSGPSVEWLRIGNATKTALINWLAPRFDGIIQAINQQPPIIEVR